MKTLIFLLFLPFFSKAQSKLTSGSSSIIIGAAPSKGSGTTTGNSSIIIGCPPMTKWATLEASPIDTVKIVMLVSDTSTVKGKPGYQDTRPYMAYGYQTSTGEILDAYKQRLSKSIIMWIAYKVR